MKNGPKMFSLCSAFSPAPAKNSSKQSDPMNDVIMPVTFEEMNWVVEYPGKRHLSVKYSAFFVFFLVLTLARSHAFADLFMYGQQRAPAQTWSVSGVGAMTSSGSIGNGPDNLNTLSADSTSQIVFDGTAPFRALSNVSHTTSGGNPGSAIGSAVIGSLNSSVYHGDPFNGQLASRSINDVAWYDCATIDSSGLAGQTGIMNVRINVQGLLEAVDEFNGNGVGAQGAIAFLWFTRLQGPPNTGGAFQFDRNWGTRSDVPPTTRFINESLEFGVPFQFGSQFEFYVRGLTVANPTSNPRPVGESSAELSIQWGGIQSITHNGNIVDFSVSSTSGFNYRNSVPEPSSLMLIVLATGVACFKRTRCKHT